MASRAVTAAYVQKFSNETKYRPEDGKVTAALSEWVR